MILNKGNTCYLSAALQCIVWTNSIERYIRRSTQQTKKEAILFYKLFSCVRNSVVCDPDELYKQIRIFYKPFNNKEQNDAHEAVIVIIEYLRTFMTPIPNTRYVGSREGCLSWGERHSIVDEIYKVQFENRIQCMHCNHVILKHECTYGLYDTFTGLGNHTLPGYICDMCHRTNTCSEYVSVSHYPQTLIIRVRPTTNIHKLTFRFGIFIYTAFAVCRYIPCGKKDSGHYNVGVFQEGKWKLVDDDVVTTSNVDDILRDASIMFLTLDSRVE
jgi:ubiquitin C-terminal hydrolase